MKQWKYIKSSLQLCPGIWLLQRTHTICQYATLMKSNGIVYKKISLIIVKIVWLPWLHDQTHCVNNIVGTLLFDGIVCNTSSSGMSDKKTYRILTKLYFCPTYKQISFREPPWEKINASKYILYGMQLNPIKIEFMALNK